MKKLAIIILLLLTSGLVNAHDFEYQLTKLNSYELSEHYPFSTPLALSFKLKNESSVTIEFHYIVKNDSINKDMIMNANLIKKYEFSKLDSGNYRFSWNLTYDIPDDDEVLMEFIYLIFIDNELFKKQLFSIAR